MATRIATRCVQAMRRALLHLVRLNACELFFAASPRIVNAERTKAPTEVAPSVRARVQAKLLAGLLKTPLPGENAFQGGIFSF